MAVSVQGGVDVRNYILTAGLGLILAMAMLIAKSNGQAVQGPALPPPSQGIANDAERPGTSANESTMKREGVPLETEVRWLPPAGGSANPLPAGITPVSNSVPAPPGLPPPPTVSGAPRAANPAAAPPSATAPNLPNQPLPSPSENKQVPDPKQVAGPLLSPTDSPAPLSAAASAPPPLPPNLDAMAGPPLPSGAPASKEIVPTAVAPGLEAAGPHSPVISLQKIGPGTLPWGQPLTYEIVVCNHGSDTVTNVHVEEELPSGAHFVSAEPAPEPATEKLRWSLGDMGPGSQRQIKITLQPRTVGDFASRATATFSLLACLQTRVTRPQLGLAMTGPKSAQVGDSLVFQIHVSNTGTGTAANVVLHEHLPAGFWHEQGNNIDADIGTLAPGETKNVTLVTTATRSGTQVNDAVVTGADGLKASARASVLLTEPQLALHYSGPQKRYLNRPAELALELTNPGTAAAKNVHVTDTLPEGLEFASASDGGTYDPLGRTVTWAVGAVPAGQKHNYIVRVVAKAPGNWVSKVSAQGERGVQAKAETGLHIEGISALHLEIADLDDPIEIGAETTYEIHVKNQGTSESTGIEIVASIPAGMIIRDASGPAPHRIDGQQIVFGKIAQLAPRADAVFRVRVVGQQPGDMRFKAQLLADHMGHAICEEKSTRVYGDQ
jgi:uncharacterized repeat protein (TIGR01451 family)